MADRTLAHAEAELNRVAYVVREKWLAAKISVEREEREDGVFPTDSAIPATRDEIGGRRHE
jgi:hypothetical protein